jgi:hypothetical protein
MFKPRAFVSFRLYLWWEYVHCLKAWPTYMMSGTFCNARCRPQASWWRV